MVYGRTGVTGARVMYVVVEELAHEHARAQTRHPYTVVTIVLGYHTKRHSVHSHIIQVK